MEQDDITSEEQVQAIALLAALFTVKVDHEPGSR
jgi:hypothetical protein